MFLIISLFLYNYIIVVSTAEDLQAGAMVVVSAASVSQEGVGALGGVLDAAVGVGLYPVRTQPARTRTRRICASKPTHAHMRDQSRPSKLRIK
jgi:hypothetical protein